MLALNMPSSSPSGPRSWSLWHIHLLLSFSLLTTIPVCWKSSRALFLQLDFSVVTRKLKYCNNCSFYSNAAGRIARIYIYLVCYFLAYKQIIWHSAIYTLGGPQAWIIRSTGATLVFSFQCCCMKYVSLSVVWLSWQVRLSYWKKCSISGDSWNMQRHTKPSGSSYRGANEWS